MSVSQSLLDRVARTLFGNLGSKKPKKPKAVNTRRLQFEPLESREMLAVGPIADVEFPVPVRCDALYNGGISRTEIRSEASYEYDAVTKTNFHSYEDWCDQPYILYITEIRSEGTTTTNRRENLSQTLDWSYTYGSNGVTNENFKETYYKVVQLVFLRVRFSGNIGSMFFLIFPLFTEIIMARTAAQIDLDALEKSILQKILRSRKAGKYLQARAGA